MRILVISALFPPQIKGGAEISAYNAAKWLRDCGHIVGVLSTADQPSDVVNGEMTNGFPTWRVKMPRTYSRLKHENQPKLAKIRWHLQDHFDPRNITIMDRVLSEFRPDLVQIHVLGGLGHNSLAAINRAGLPVVYFLHDLGLACLRASMYKSGENCQNRCFDCKLFSADIMRQINDPKRYSFVSPSQANLDELRRHLDLGKFHCEVLPNLDFDIPPAHQPRTHCGPIKLLFVGRLHPTKGIHFLLEILDQINSDEIRASITVIGGGPLEPEFNRRYGQKEWATFTGHISPAEVHCHMAASDALCVPSLWRENHPGVVRQALRCGTPALVSKIGGIPEMLTHDWSGLVLEPGDKEAWLSALLRLIGDRPDLRRLQKGALEDGEKFNVGRLGQRLEGIVTAALERSGSSAKSKITETCAL